MWVLGAVINVDIRNFSKWAKNNEAYAPILVGRFYKFLQEKFLEIKKDFYPEEDKDKTLFKPLGDGGLFIFGLKEVPEDSPKKVSDEILSAEDKNRIEEIVSSVCEKIPSQFSHKIIKPISEAGGRAESLAIGIGISFGILKIINLDDAGKKIDFFGNAINLASRLGSKAQPQGIVIDVEGLPFLEQSLKSQNYTIAEIMLKGFPPIKAAFSPEVKEIPLKKPHKREEYQHHIEVHVAALCFKEENGQLYILAGKRKASRELYPGLWEFGGGQVHEGETFEGAIKRQLLEEFGVKAEVLAPFVTYSIPPKGERALIPGLRLICYCVDNSSLKEEGEEHDIVKWIPVEEIDKYHFIPGLKEVARSAAERFKELLIKKGAN
ncbi:NUDIX domain-containing protein [Desulfonauticus submarinus]